VEKINWFTRLLTLLSNNNTNVFPRETVIHRPYFDGPIAIYQSAWEGAPNQFCVGWGKKRYHFHVLQDGTLQSNFDYRNRFPPEELENQMRQIWMGLM
jgi:hypothetical protein